MKPGMRHTHTYSSETAAAPTSGSPPRVRGSPSRGLTAGLGCDPLAIHLGSRVGRDGKFCLDVVGAVSPGVTMSHNTTPTPTEACAGPAARPPGPPASAPKSPGSPHGPCDTTTRWGEGDAGMPRAHPSLYRPTFRDPLAAGCLRRSAVGQGKVLIEFAVIFLRGWRPTTLHLRHTEGGGGVWVRLSDPSPSTL